MSRRWFNAFWVVLLVLSWASFGLAQSPTYIVGVEELPYLPHYTSHDKTYSGFARELLDAFAQQQGYVFSYRILPIKRLFKTFLHQSTLDLKYPDNPYWQAEMKQGITVHYSDPVVTFIDGVMVRPDHKGKGVAQLKKLGSMAGFTARPYRDHIDSGAIRILTHHSFDALLKQVLRQNTDGAYINVAVAHYRLEKTLNNPGALVFDPGLPHIKDSYRLSSIKYPQLIAEFNEFLTQKKDIVETLKQKHQVEAGIP